MTKTNLLKRLVISDLKSRGHLAWGNNTMGVWDPRKKVFRKNQDRSAIGTADIVCCLKGGLYLELEVKADRDKQSAAQEWHERDVCATGGMYFVIKEFRDYQNLRSINHW
jgi:hypothetical protein